MASFSNVQYLLFLVLFWIFTLQAESVCPRGKFGFKCRLTCGRCLQGEICDPQTGTCPSGCQSGYYGHHCLFSSDCIYDSKGNSYRGTINVTKNGTSCIAWLKNETILVNPDEVDGNYCRNPQTNVGIHSKLWCYTKGRKAEDCEVKECACPNYLYGEGCINECHCKNDNDICTVNKMCGSCADGWDGAKCDIKCAHGKYGPGCSKSCSMCLNSDCDHETGKCLSGCLDGYTGDFCLEKCQGRYGPGCANTCGQCQNGETCHHLTGDCSTGCAPGYESSSHVFRLCDKQCKNKYGQDCKHKCGACRDTKVCDPATGLCSTGCADGYTTTYCNQTCPQYKYGKDCSKTCGECKDNETCDPLTGNCRSGCKEGHQGYECSEKITAKDSSSTAVLGAGVGVGVGVAVLLLCLGCFIYRRRNKKLHVSTRNLEVVEDTLNRDESCQLLGDSRIGSEPPSFVREEDDNFKNETQEPIYMNVTTPKRTSPVAIDDLYDYILKNKEHSCEGFKREFDELPMGLIAPCEVARRQENKVKNRYGNIVAYDHSRVLLDPVPSEPTTDYVNASYMDGYFRPKAYIASQGPNKVMIKDFWRMVWQQRVSKIVMLTNLMEACKKKCEQYWPEEGSNKYGDVTVLLVNTTKYSDFTIRTFELTKEMEHNRIVKQFHFTTWSDHGAPTYPTTLLAFRKKVMNFKPDDTAPILSHCSAGIGRTGTFIALNYLLDQASDKKEVDVLACAQLMRANRVNMIQTLEQYMFVYDAVLEAIKAGNTTIPRSNFHSTYEAMLVHEEGQDSPMVKQHDVLQLLSPTIEREECSSALDEENMSKNRFKNILPANRSRPYLYTQVEGCNDYINAVYLSGYTQKEQFIVTQMPLPTTVADFWRMLYDTSSDTIIMLNEFDRNDKTCALYWPEEYGYSEEHGPLSVELLSSSEADQDVTIRVFKLSHQQKGEERAIKQFMFKSWPDYQTQPNSVNALLRLYGQVNEWLKQNSKGPMTVHCMNGASKSGVFVATSLLLERLDLDYEVDVYQTVKQIRINRPQFIENLEQYKFLYQVVQEYMDREG